TMRTFHIGGAATKVSEENRIYLRYPVYVKKIEGNLVKIEGGRSLFTRKGKLIVCRVLKTLNVEKNDKVLVTDGQKVVKGEGVIKHAGQEIVSDEIAYVRIINHKILLIAQDQKVDVRNGAELLVKEEEIVPSEEPIAVFDPFSEPIISEYPGIVKFEDIILGTTLKEELNEDTGNVEKKITDIQVESLQPRIIIQDEKGNELASYYIPGSAYLNVEKNAKIKAGKTLAKLLKESVKTRDITGGLPRVGELFEARWPKTSSILAQIGGIVRFKGIVKGKRIIVVEDPYGKEYKHLVPMGRHLFARDGDSVEAGEMLCDGSIDPHDVLLILGENALQRFLVNEIQEVYRLQGVNINDKHIGVIIRQMMRKVEVKHVGDTKFIFGQQVDKYRFHEENDRVINEGGQSAIAMPLLLGITRASLNIDSFISAASFQETTRVLTNAAIAGASDSLRGLKENVIIGHLIPAGTGIRGYRNVKLFDDTSEDLDKTMQEILEAKRLAEETEKKIEEIEDDTLY
ncbi:MAG: DNA-directed RNA polymerase subunit beta', partial [Spirochaetales bacterium]